MTTQPKPPADDIGVPELPLRCFTVSEYYAMAEAGILKKEERVDLLDGFIVDPDPPATPLYYFVVNKLNAEFIRVLDKRAISRVRGTIALDIYNAPEADLVLLREREDFYSSRTPGPDDVLLLFEVSESSVDYDRNEKLPRYARAGIPEVWLTVLPEGVVESHTEPTQDGYRVTRRLRAGDVLRPGCFSDVEIPVDAIMPDGPSDAETEDAQAPPDQN